MVLVSHLAQIQNVRYSCHEQVGYLLAEERQSQSTSME